jgi:hypothetical protein
MQSYILSQTSEFACLYSSEDGIDEIHELRYSWYNAVVLSGNSEHDPPGAPETIFPIKLNTTTESMRVGKIQNYWM